MAADATGSRGGKPVVLDTNTVLEWLLFRDDRAQPLWGALEAGVLRWQATPAMIGELEQVWGRSFGERWSAAQSATPLTSVLPWVTLTAAPDHATSGAWSTLRCSDRSDQKFIDFAVHLGARWLVTRDRALLKLGPRARRLCGLNILTPDRWTASSAD